MDLDNLIAKFSNSTENQSKAIFSTLFIDSSINCFNAGLFKAKYQKIS